MGTRGEGAGSRDQTVSWRTGRSLARVMGDDLIDEATGLLGQQLNVVSGIKET